MKPKLVSNWKNAWRWWSMRFALLGVAVQGAWEAIQLVGLDAHAPQWAQSAVTAVIFFGVLAGRLIDQGGKDA